MPANRRAGVLYVRIDGRQYDIIGNWTYNLGSPKREGLRGPDRVHGYKEMPQIPFIEGEIRDAKDLDVVKLQELEDVTVTLDLANGKTVVQRNSWYAADGNVGTDEANVQVRFEGLSSEESGA